MKLNFLQIGYRILVVVLIFSTQFSACKKGKEEEVIAEPTPTPIVDSCGTSVMTYLANGHILTYDFTYFGTTITLTHTIKNYGTKGEFKTILNSSIFSDSVYSKECNGWLNRSPKYPLINSYKYRKSTTALADTWTYSDASITATFVVVAKNVSVTVPAGTFSCDKITYHQVGTLNTDTIYFNNSVGDVKYVGSISYKLKAKNF